jgi:hypothetical protein
MHDYKFLGVKINGFVAMYTVDFDTPVSCENVSQAYMQSSKFSVALFFRIASFSNQTILCITRLPFHQQKQFPSQ